MHTYQRYFTDIFKLITYNISTAMFNLIEFNIIRNRTELLMQLPIPIPILMLHYRFSFKRFAFVAMNVF